MVKAKEITAFDETIKVVKHVQELEVSASKELPDVQKLQLVKAAKEKAGTLEEFEALEKEEAELTKRIKFPAWEVITVPEEQRLTVIRNYALENKQAGELLDQYNQELEKLASDMKVKVSGLLEKIENVERNRSIAFHIEGILNGDVIKNPGLERMPGIWLSNLEKSSRSHGLRRTREKLDEMTDLLLKISKRGPK